MKGPDTKPPTRARGLKRPPTKGTRVGNGAGKGDGWGGPAKGDGSKAADIRIPGQPAAKRQISLTKRQREEALAEEARLKLVELMRTADRQETQLAAASKLLDRIEGQPIARNINATVDDVSNLSDDELAKRAQELERRARSFGAGTNKSHLPN